MQQRFTIIANKHLKTIVDKYSATLSLKTIASNRIMLKTKAVLSDIFTETLQQYTKGRVMVEGFYLKEL